jgi:hypothetical protein
MTRFRISLAILLILLGISIGSMAAVRYSASGGCLCTWKRNGH